MANYMKLSNVSSEVEIELQERVEAVNYPVVSKSKNFAANGNVEKEEDEVAPPEFPPEKTKKHFRNAELIKSVCENQPNEVSRHLNESDWDDRASADATCEVNNLSAIHLAALHGNEKILEILLAHGANAKRMDSAGRSPIHFAVYANHVMCVKLLLARCRELASIKVGDFHEEVDNALLDCSVHDHGSLQSKLPEIAIGLSPLHVASQFGHFESVNLLLQVGPEVHSLENSGLTILDVAGEYLPPNTDEKVQRESFLKLITKLIDKGCRASSNTSPYRTTPLHVAVKIQSVDSIRKLLKHGYDIFIRNMAGDNTLHVCAKENLQESLKVLLSLSWHLRGKLDELNTSGFSPLHLSVLSGWLIGTKLLLDAGSNVLVLTSDFASGHETESILHLAARIGDTWILRLLLKCKGIKEIVNARNSKQESPLFLTVFGLSLESLHLLLKANADVKLKAEGKTILHQMIEHDRPALLSALFEYAPTECEDILETNYKWAVLLTGTPLHMAAHCGNVACVEILLKNKCNVRATMSFNQLSGCTALHLAAAAGKELVIRTLTKYDPSLVEDVTIETQRDRVKRREWEPTFKGWMPMHIGCQYGLQGSVQALLEAGSDLTAKCEDREGKSRTAMYLLMHRVRSPVKVLKKVLDNSIIQKNAFISVDYKILLPKARDERDYRPRLEESGDVTYSDGPPSDLPLVHEKRIKGRSNQMEVIDTLLKTGNKMKQHELMMHPLIESFLHLQWKTLRMFYYALIILYSCFVLTFTMEIIALYNLQDHKIVMLNVELFKWTAFSFLIALIVYEVIYFLHSKIEYFLQFETWVKIICYILAIVVTFVDHEQEWPRELTAAAILLSWLEFMLLFYKVPKVGFSVLLFSKVASNLFGVLLTFTFLIIGFAITFMIEFRVHPPFESTFEAIVKTIVMMTSEFEYDALFTDFKGNVFSLVIAKLIFVLFLILVGIVLMNLLVAMAVTDIEDLGNQGHMDRLRKQAEFVSVFEKIVFDNIFIRCLPKKSQKFIWEHSQVPRVLRLSMMVDQEHKFDFRQKLQNSILELANKNKKRNAKMKEEEKTREEKRKRKEQEKEVLDKIMEKANSVMTILADKRKSDVYEFSKLERKVTDLSVNNETRFTRIDEYQQEVARNSEKILQIVETRDRPGNVQLPLIRSKPKDLAKPERNFDLPKQDSDVEKNLQKILSLLENSSLEPTTSTSVRRRVHEIQTLRATPITEDVNSLKLRHQEVVSLLNSIAKSLESKAANEDVKLQQLNRTISNLVMSHRDFAGANLKAMENLLKTIGDLSKSIEVLAKKTTPSRAK